MIGDPVRLRQVLLNLTGNSIKFTRSGGVTLHVKADPTADTRSGTVHRIRFAVEDTGIGISKEAQKNLFNPFAQADESVSRKFGGTGLGLAISQRLIEAMGGRIHIDSTEGKGSTFFFTLIVENGSAAGVDSQAASLSAVKAEKSLRILIVEDNEINQKLLQEFLHRFGHKSVQVGSGEDAMETLDKESFDLILMDIELPGMSGMGTTKSIRALPDRAKAATPIIALTGNTRDEDIRKAYSVNMNGHLAKPVDPKRLRAMIDKVTGGALDNPVELPDEADVRPYRRPTPPVIQEKAPEPAPAPQPRHDDLEALLAMSEDMSPLAAQYGAPRNGGSNSNGNSNGRGANGHAPAVETGANGRLVFDASTLAPLKGAMAHQELQSMIDGLFDKLEEIIGGLDDNSLQGDMESVTARAHDLKGMSGNYGLLEISKVAADIEASTRQHHMDEAKALMSMLPEAGQRARSALQAWLDN